jgi:hypothetical protein
LKSAVLAERSSRHRPSYPVIGPVLPLGGGVVPPLPPVILLKIVEYW